MATAKMTKAQLLEHIAVLEAKVGSVRVDRAKRRARTNARIAALDARLTVGHQVCADQRGRIKQLEAELAARGRIVPRTKNEVQGTGQAVGAPYRNAAGKLMQKWRIGFNLYTHREVQGEVAQ